MQIILKNDNVMGQVMRVNAKDKKYVTLTLVNKEVKAAKLIVGDFIKRMRKVAVKNNSPTLYVTILLMLHLISGEMLDSYGVSNMAELLNAYHEDNPQN